LLICPGLTGLDAMRALADDDSLGLPSWRTRIPGSFRDQPDNGISPFALFGQLMRLAGATPASFRILAAGSGFPWTSVARWRTDVRTHWEIEKHLARSGGGLSLQRPARVAGILRATR